MTTGTDSMKRCKSAEILGHDLRLVTGLAEMPLRTRTSTGSWCLFLSITHGGRYGAWQE